MPPNETIETIQAFIDLIDKGIIELVRDEDGVLRPMIVGDEKYGELVILD